MVLQLPKKALREALGLKADENLDEQSLGYQLAGQRGQNGCFASCGQEPVRGQGAAVSPRHSCGCPCVLAGRRE